MYALNFRDELEEPVQRELDKLIARFKGVILKEHNDDGSHKFDFSNLNDAALQRLIDASQAKGQWWKYGPWLIDDPDAVNPNAVGLDIDVPTGTYDDWAPTGIDTAIVVEINPTGGDVTLTGIKATDGARHKRILVIRNSNDTNSVHLPHDDSGSIEPFRFELPDGEDVEVAPGQNIWCFYSTRSQRWTAAITAQAAGAVIPISGGSSPVFATVVTLTDTQIKAGGAHTLIAAPGAGIVNIPFRVVTRITRSNSDAASANQTGTIRYTGHTNNLLSGTLDWNWAGTLSAGRKNAVYSGGNYDTGWESGGTDTDPRNKAIEISLSATTSGTVTLGATLVIFYGQSSF